MKKLLALLLMVSITALSACSNDTDSSLLDSSIPAEVTTSAVVEPVSQGDENMILNGDFSSGMDNWFTYTNGGTVVANVVDGMLELDIQKTGALDYATQIYQDGFKLDEGCTYLFTYDAYSTLDRAFEARFQLNGGDYHAYALQAAELTAETQSYSFEFTMAEASDPSPRLAINMGTPVGLEELEPHKIYFDNFKLILLDDSNKVETVVVDMSKDININQLGYLPSGEKVAIFRGDSSDKTFDVVKAGTDDVIFTGDITGSLNNSTADETNRYGDFSSVKTAGKYIIRTTTLGDSYEFEIKEKVYDAAFNDVVKMLYIQRCGTELTEKLAGDFKHEVCHTGLATIHGTNTKIDVSGGWHDAGDYGRYIVPASKTVADLLISYSQNSDAFSDNVGIPESGNGTPDILDEVRYELEWMLKMQASSGGVYHKVTCETFPDMVLPEEETAPLVISPISDAATGDFAAAMAMSYEVFKDYDKAFAQKCLDAAKKSWDYLNAKTSFTGFTNPGDIVTGEYGDSNANDEFFWASVELFKATGDSKYHTVVKSNYSSLALSFGWDHMGGYAVYSYLKMPAASTDKTLAATMKADFLAAADKLLAASKNDGYGISLTEYTWGSNMGVANNAMHLLLANEISPKSDYVKYAAKHLDYIYGANPMSISYVTGHGAYSPENTHHRPSYAIDKTLPGMLVGGANQNLEDPYAKAVLADAPPAKCYVDNTQSFSCNEITIYWNSPLIYLMSSFK